MKAVIESGSKQYIVEKDQVLYTELRSEKVGDTITLDKVLLVYDKENVHIGTPYLNKAVVKAIILDEIKGDKIHGFKYKRRKNQHRRWGHRQQHYKIQITSVSA